MEQLDLLSPRSRRSDPETSHLAAKHALAFSETHAGRILAALRQHGPATADELARRVNLNGHQVNKRLPELARGGFVRATGETRPSLAGVPERVWSAA